MIDPVLFVVTIVFFAALSRSFPLAAPVYRLLLCCFPGALILLYFNVYSLAFALISAGVSWFTFAVCRRIKSFAIRNYAPYVLLLLIFVPEVAGWHFNSRLLLIGSAFFVVRQFIVVKEALKPAPDSPQVGRALVLATFFFPAIFVGPIFNGVTAYRELSQPGYAPLKVSLFKMLEGFTFITIISDFVFRIRLKVGSMIAETDSQVFAFALEWAAIPIISFVFIYTTFFGYSRLAESGASLFGFDVPENFNRPYLARDFADFWKRWHRSMADFVMQYIYLPLSVLLKAPRFAVVCAFVFMGLWHEVSPGYLVWGIGHGLLVGWVAPRLRNSQISPALLRILTLVTVVGLSFIATS